MRAQRPAAVARRRPVHRDGLLLPCRCRCCRSATSTRGSSASVFVSSAPAPSTLPLRASSSSSEHNAASRSAPTVALLDFMRCAPSRSPPASPASTAARIAARRRGASPRKARISLRRSSTPLPSGSSRMASNARRSSGCSAIVESDRGECNGQLASAVPACGSQRGRTAERQSVTNGLLR